MLKKDKIVHDKYFQGVLQIRNPNSEVMAYLEKWLDNRKNREVSMVKEVTNGVDYYFVSNKTLLVVGRLLHEQFGGETKRTSTLHTRDNLTSKDLHRGTILIILPDFVKGDIIVVNDVPYGVKSVSKTIVTCIDLVKRKIKKIDFVKQKVNVLNKFTVVVSKVRPSLEVLDPESYQSIKVENPFETTRKKIKIVKHKGRIYAVTS